MEVIPYKPGALFSHAWKTLSDQGIKPDYPPDLANNIRIINQSSFISFLLTATSPLYLQHNGIGQEHKFIFLLLSFLFLVNIFFNSLQYHRLAQTLPFAVGALIIFWGSYTFGYNSHVHFLFVCIIFGITLNFGQGSWRFFFLIISFCILLVLLLFLGGFSFKPSPIPAEIQNKISYLSFTSCIVITVVFSFIYVKNQNRLISELREAQHHFEQKNSELKKRSHELDKFVYRISHDLRAPIATLMGLTNIGKKEKNREQALSYLNLQEISLKKLDSFITEMVEYSHTTRLDVQQSDVELETLISEVFAHYSTIEKTKNLKKIIVINQKGTIITDKERLKIILNNLIANAIYYSNPGIEEPFVKIEVEADENKITLKVSDNGMGIGREHLDKIFQMFYKANPSGKGFGLGLYIVQEAIEKLKGKIEVCSELGKGTEFIIYLPSFTSLSAEEQASQMRTATDEIKMPLS